MAAPVFPSLGLPSFDTLIYSTVQVAEVEGAVGIVAVLNTLLVTVGNR